MTKTATIDRIRAYRIFWLCLIAVFVLDQLTKWWVVAFSGFQKGVYPPQSGQQVIPGVLNLVYAVNDGAAWGMFSGYGIFLIALGVLTLILLFVFRASIELRVPFCQLAFGLICGGILGNTLDRLLHGHVIDFIDVDLQFYRWPTFNIADSGIVTGALLYLFHSFRTKD